MRKKTWSLVLCAAMAASMMAGCGAKQETAATTASGGGGGSGSGFGSGSDHSSGG